MTMHGGDVRQVLHVGCGAASREKLHPVFRDPGWQEIRLDIDEGVAPDIVSSITAMDGVASSSMDAVYSSHNLEHLYPHQVPTALREFRRVLMPWGFALVTMPDLQGVAQLVADDGLTEPAYVSPMGPIAPLDILFGFRPALAQNNLYMAHHTGFTAKSLMAALGGAGFAFSTVQRVPRALCLWAIAFAEMPSAAVLEEAQYNMLPLHMALRSEQRPHSVGNVGGLQPA